jgi:hypothetical protein
MQPNMTVRTCIATLGGVLAVPFALQAQTFVPREGCSHLVTIQSEGCLVRHVVTCPDMAGSGPLVFATGKDGVVVATAFDADGATMFTGPQGAGMLVRDRTDLFSLSALTAKGTDSYDYTMAGPDGVEVHFSGTTTLSGEAVTIDGRSLQVLQIRQSVTRDGAATAESDITALYDAEFALVLTAEARDAATGEVRVQRRPVDFLFPGDADALSTVPQYGCTG